MKRLVAAAVFAFVSAGTLSFCYASDMGPDDLAKAKRAMIEHHLIGRDIRDPAVLEAMEKVPREEFVEQSQRMMAYDDNPLPIGHGQTISQPYIVALMTQALRPVKTDRVLEVGSGSGYQAAVLAQIVDHVYTIEIIKPLADETAKRLARLGYKNVTVRNGDGYLGWKEHAPFDKIIVTAAADKVPPPLEEQLKEGGRLIMPVGGDYLQYLLLGVKRDGRMRYSNITAVRFVPMTGAAEEKER